MCIIKQKSQNVTTRKTMLLFKFNISSIFVSLIIIVTCIMEIISDGAIIITTVSIVSFKVLLQKQIFMLTPLNNFSRSATIRNMIK